MEELKENTGATENVETEETVTMTKQELDALLQKTSDARVSQALKTVEKKNQEKVKEASKLAAMNETQKYEYELEQREKAIEEKEKQLALAENTNIASKILSEKGISLDLVKFVVADDAETMNDNIKLLEKAFKASVKKEVEARLGSPTPKKTAEVSETMTKEQFRKIKDINVLNDIKNNNPELWAEMTRDYK